MKVQKIVLQRVGKANAFLPPSLQKKNLFFCCFYNALGPLGPKMKPLC